ncbi:dentin sialophosphoprotein-like [Impatiens glandulifera]|uniref:dentin sialophosphoprotein-like n=1 Tax=Impatiens glandulifera TaxID=253017 RepID=UPI001FB07EAF|nr:dentin sialophosphoprotein-like [Impatiens glandulifera]
MKFQNLSVSMRNIRPKLWKSIVFSSRICYRSVCNHPFMVVMMTFMLYMYRSFPYLFFLFLSASPVLISTGILLGILLIYGQPNVPHVAKMEQTITRKVEPVKTAAAVGRFTGKYMEETNYSEVDTESEMEKEDGISTVLAREIQSDKRPIEEVKVSGFMVKRGIDEDKIDSKKGIGNHYSLIQEVVDEDDDETGKDRSPVESIDTRLADIADSSASQGEESDEDEVVSDTESDSAESSIPDPSMADIMPMLDELHPLLDEDAPQPVHVTDDDDDDDDDSASEPSQNNGDSAKESDDEGGDDDDDDDEDEGEESGKEDAMKSVITWTEDDHKNLLNLGSSELERNQRLEHLIARRRAHRKISERNLIDLESSDLPSSVAHISTKRLNPFDLPFDESFGLPLIPGSAPSLMIPRQNPFDIQFDLNEEKRESIQHQQQQAVKPSQPKESSSSSSSAAPASSFRRHESFNMGPSVFALSRQEKFDAIFRPYYFQYQLGLEGTTSYSSIPRNASEPSESKASSNSTSSVSDDDQEEDKKHNEEEDLSEEPNILCNSDSEHHPLQSVGHDIESSSSSSSSLSEDAGERYQTEDDNNRNHHPEQTEKMLDERDHSPKTLEEIRTGDEDANQHKEKPVYDSSPNSVQRSLFANSSDSTTMDNGESDSGNRSLEVDDASSKAMQPSDEGQKNNDGDSITVVKH